MKNMAEWTEGRVPMKDRMRERRKRMAAAAVLLTVFGGLLALATVFDLQVSYLLAAPNLVEGRYFSTNFFCNLVEVAAMAPIWGFATFIPITDRAPAGLCGFSFSGCLCLRELFFCAI